jgi:hypothetical protein
VSEDGREDMSRTHASDGQDIRFYPARPTKIYATNGGADGKSRTSARHFLGRGVREREREKERGFVHPSVGGFLPILPGPVFQERGRHGPTGEVGGWVAWVSIVIRVVCVCVCVSSRIDRHGATAVPASQPVGQPRALPTNEAAVGGWVALREGRRKRTKEEESVSEYSSGSLAVRFGPVSVQIHLEHSRLEYYGGVGGKGRLANRTGKRGGSFVNCSCRVRNQKSDVRIRMRIQMRLKGGEGRARVFGMDRWMEG